MMEELGVLQHNMANSSPVVFENLIFVSTSNGQDESHVHVPSPKAPSIIALNKTTGKLVWEDNSVEDRILHGQWSTPAVGDVSGVMQVVHAQGDGWVRGYEAQTGKPYWTHDMFAAIWGSPIIIDDKVYLGDEDGDVTVLQHGKEMKVVSEQNMGSSVYATAVPANGKLFLMNRNQLWALEEGAT